jgi:hypothetical protein
MYGINVHIIQFLRLSKIHDINFYITIFKMSTTYNIEKISAPVAIHVHRHNVNKHLSTNAVKSWKIRSHGESNPGPEVLPGLPKPPVYRPFRNLR